MKSTGHMQISVYLFTWESRKPCNFNLSVESSFFTKLHNYLENTSVFVLRDLSKEVESKGVRISFSLHWSCRMAGYSLRYHTERGNLSWSNDDSCINGNSIVKMITLLISHLKPLIGFHAKSHGLRFTCRIKSPPRHRYIFYTQLVNYRISWRMTGLLKLIMSIWDSSTCSVCSNVS